MATRTAAVCLVSLLVSIQASATPVIGGVFNLDGSTVANIIFPNGSTVVLPAINTSSVTAILSEPLGIPGLVDLEFSIDYGITQSTELAGILTGGISIRNFPSPGPYSGSIAADGRTQVGGVVQAEFTIRTRCVGTSVECAFYGLPAPFFMTGLVDLSWPDLLIESLAPGGLMVSQEPLAISAFGFSMASDLEGFQLVVPEPRMFLLALSALVMIASAAWRTGRW